MTSFLKFHKVKRMKSPEIPDDNFKKFINNELESISDIQLLVLKGHVLIEYSLNKFIEASFDETFKLNKTNFTFSHKINIAKALGLFWKNKSDFLEDHIKDINKLRNQIAHSLSFDNQILERIINYYIEIAKTPHLMGREKSDFDNFFHVIPSICGNIIGRKISKQKIASFTKAILNKEMNKDPEQFKKELGDHKTNDSEEK